MSVSKTYSIILLGMAVLWLFWPGPVSAQSDNPLEIIRYVNELRAASGLAAYQMDSGLMTYAQEHADYLASTQQCTHLRADGSIPFSLGLTENVASGEIGYLTSHDAVYSAWADPGHMKTMVGHATGFIGAGVAFNGNQTYYTLDVRPGTTEAASVTQGSGIQSAGTTPPQIKPLVASTALADGSLVHVVGYGQTLWTISQAYGVQADDIRKLNNIPFNTNTIYAGQKLIVRKAETAIPPPQKKTDAPSVPISSVTQQDIPTGAAAEEVPEMSTSPTAESGFGGKAQFAFLHAVGLVLGFTGVVLLLVWLWIFQNNKS